MFVPDLTLYVVSHLEADLPRVDNPPDTLRRSSQETRKKSQLKPACSGILALPVEIVYQIISNLPRTSTLAVRRTCKALYSRIILNQRFWRYALVSGSLVSFLWDLDPMICQENGPAEHWDWKSLAQRLLVWTAFDTGGEFDDAPLALRNRQNIWTIVMDIGCRDKGDWECQERMKGIPKVYLLPGSDEIA